MGTVGDDGSQGLDCPGPCELCNSSYLTRAVAGASQEGGTLGFSGAAIHSHQPSEPHSRSRGLPVGDPPGNEVRCHQRCQAPHGHRDAADVVRQETVNHVKYLFILFPVFNNT